MFGNRTILQGPGRTHVKQWPMHAVEAWRPDLRSSHRARPTHLCAYFQIEHDISKKQEKRLTLAKGGDVFGGPFFSYLKQQFLTTVAENTAIAVIHHHSSPRFDNSHCTEHLHFRQHMVGEQARVKSQPVALPPLLSRLSDAPRTLRRTKYLEELELGNARLMH